MNKLKSIKLISILFATFFLAACGGDKSAVVSGSGSTGVMSDGGSGSSAFAGTYVGTITVRARGDDINEESTDAATLLIRTNGTARLTIDSESIEGEISGNAFGFSVRIIEEDGLLECSADAVLTGTIAGSVASGMLFGSGDCSVVGVKTGFDVDGTFSATKT